MKGQSHCCRLSSNQFELIRGGGGGGGGGGAGVTKLHQQSQCIPRAYRLLREKGKFLEC